MTKVLDFKKYKKEKELGKIRSEAYFTLDEVEEIAWEFLESVLDKDELQEIAWRIEQKIEMNKIFILIFMIKDLFGRL